MRYVYVVENDNDGIIGVFSNMNAAIEKMQKYSDIEVNDNELKELRRKWVLIKSKGIIHKCPLYDS